VLGRNRYFSINASFGYEHFQGFTRICGDFIYDLPVALFQPGAYRLFRLNGQTGVFEELRAPSSRAAYGRSPRSR
jgi:hypothetical protein